MAATLDGKTVAELQQAFKRLDVGQALVNLKGAPLNYDEAKVLEQLIEQTEGKAEAPKGEFFRFRPCVHSMVKPDCPSCLQGHASRLEAQLRKLEASTALPIRDRIEKAIREQMTACYKLCKGVPPTVEDWVSGALHYVMWGLERDLPLAPSQEENDGGASSRQV